MQIRVLGSVDVERNGSPVRPAGPKQRAVLSMPALNANATVSLERLVDGLWGEEPPSTAPKMVQQYVSQLRRLFAEDGAQILTRDGGYELRVDAAAVDVLRFERLVEQASHEGDGRRSELARQALELWHDPPLAGMRWDAVSGRVEERFAAHTGPADALAVTPDGEIAISAGIDGRVALWNVAGSPLLRPVALRRPFEVDDFTPRGVAISPDDRTLAVTESDGTVDLVDTTTLRRRAGLRAGAGPALAVDFSPDGRLLAVTGAHGHVSLWDARTLAPVARLAGLSDWTQAVAFSPDGRLLAAGDVNGDRPLLRVWDVRTRAATAFDVALPANAVAFSPDGRLLAAAAMDKGVEIRDPRTARLVAALRTDELARSVAFTPDGRLLFVGLLNGAGQFYSTRDWRPAGGRIRGQEQRLLNGHFTPDGRTLATSSADGTVMLWDVATRKPIGSPLAVQRDSFVAAVISRDGAHLYALPTTTNGVRLALSPEAWKDEACAVAGRELTAREWADALPSRKYLPVCRSA